MPRTSGKWRLLLALTLCASLVALGTIVVTPSAQAGFYDTTGQGPGGGGGGEPTSSGDPDIPGGAAKSVRTDGAISTTVNPESGSTAVVDARTEWTMRLMVVLLGMRGFLFRF